jgi:hypothetical protein
MKGLRGGLMKARQLVLGFSKGMARVGGALFGLGAIPIGAGLFKALDTLGDVAKLENAAKALGMSSEGASKLFGTLAANGGDFKEDLEGIVQFGAKVGDAIKGGGGEAAKLFEGLSISAKDLVGVPLDEQFWKVLAAIKELPQELQANKLALVGGTDSMKKWLPLLSRSTEELKAMGEANKMSAKDMAEAREATTAYQMATASLGMAWRQVAIALAPAIKQIADVLIPQLRAAAGWIGENKGLAAGLAAAAAGAMAAGAALLVLSVGLAALATVAGAAAAALGLLFSPAGLAVATAAVAVVMVAALADEVGLLEPAVNALGQAWEFVARTFGTAWAGIKAAVGGGDLEGAFEIAVQGMRVVWAGLVLFLTKTWNRFKAGFIDAWRLMIADVRAQAAELDGDDAGAKRIRDAAADRVKESMTARRKDVQAAERDLRHEQARLAGKTRRAEEAAATRDNTNLFAQFMTDLANTKFKAAATVAAATVAGLGSTRGQFGGGGLAAALGVGAGSAGDKIAKNTERTADAVEEMAENGLGLPAW